MKKSFLFVVLSIIVIALFSSACSSKQTVYAEGEEKDKAITTTNPFAKDILDGINNNDYATFVKDCDETTAKALTQDQFKTITESLSKLGAYQSHEAEDVEIVDKYYRVSYKVTYEKGSFIMRIVIPQEGTPAVTGLWFK